MRARLWPCLLLVAACVHRPHGQATAVVASAAPPLGAPVAPPSPVPGPAQRAPHPAVDVEALLGRLTLEQKVGQLMMVGFSGTTVDASIEALVRGKQVGGVCLFKRNIEGSEQIAHLNDALLKLLEEGVPPFIAVDQEGGNVVRIFDGVLVLPGNMALGATRSPKLAYLAGRAQGDDLRRLGFNMNLAPVLDVNLNPRNPVIGIRSFGDSVSLVSDFGADFVRGQQQANVVTVAKHFPGHGSVSADSHRSLPVLRETEAEFLTALAPFEAAIAVGLDGMMTAHVAAPNVTGDQTPATLSGHILTDILRRRLGFDGLVLTDELEMEAIADRYGVGRAAVMAVNAGADMVLVPWRVERKAEVHAALLEAAKSGQLSPARLDESVRRILSLKVKRGVFEPLPALADRLRQLGSQRGLADEISRGAVTLLRADPRVFPLNKSHRRVAVVTAEASLVTAIQARSPDATALVVPAFPAAGRRNELKLLTQQLAAGADVVVVGVVNSMQLELVTNAALTGKPVVAVVMGLPYLAAQAPEAKAVLAVYSYRESATEAAAAALFGEAGTPGKLPVALPRYPFGFGLDPVGERLAREGRSGPASFGGP